MIPHYKYTHILSFKGNSCSYFLEFCFFVVKQVLYRLSNPSRPFCSSYFGDGVSWVICPSFPWTMILPSSVPQEARIAGMSHQTQIYLLDFLRKIKLSVEFCPMISWHLWRTCNFILDLLMWLINYTNEFSDIMWFFHSCNKPYLALFLIFKCRFV
jgi:hypothetical protein